MFIIGGINYLMTLVYNHLGYSELKVSNICLGTMTFGEQTSQEEAFKILDFARKQQKNVYLVGLRQSFQPRNTVTAFQRFQIA